MKIIKWLEKIVKNHLARSTTDPVIWEAAKERNKKGQRSNLVAGWKNNV